MTATTGGKRGPLPYGERWAAARLRIWGIRLVGVSDTQGRILNGRNQVEC